MNLLNTCDNCRELISPPCINLVLELGFADGTYYAFIQDQREKKWVIQCTSTAGVITINKTSVAPGLFDAATGPLQIQFATDTIGKTPIQFSVGYDTFTCLSVSFAST